MPAIDEFRSNIQLVRNLVGLGQAIAAQTTLDPSDVYRSSLAMAVSALDRYVHEKTSQEMMRVHRGARPTTTAFDRFQVSLLGARTGVANPTIDTWLQTEIRTAHELKSFQKADSIADAVRLFSGVELWNGVSASIGLPAADIKIRINVMTDRRNKIVHEFDSDPTTPGARWPVDAAMAKDTTDFISMIVEAIEVVT